MKLYYESLKCQGAPTGFNPTRFGTELSPIIYKQIEAVQHAIDTDFLGEFDTDAAERLEELRSRLEEIEQSVRWL